MPGNSLQNSCHIALDGDWGLQKNQRNAESGKEEKSWNSFLQGRRRMRPVMYSWEETETLTPRAVMVIILHSYIFHQIIFQHILLALPLFGVDYTFLLN